MNRPGYLVESVEASLDRVNRNNDRASEELEAFPLLVQQAVDQIRDWRASVDKALDTGDTEAALDAAYVGITFADSDFLEAAKAVGEELSYARVTDETFGELAELEVMAVEGERLAHAVAALATEAEGRKLEGGNADDILAWLLASLAKAGKYDELELADQLKRFHLVA